MSKLATTFRQLPVNCSGHTRPVLHLDFSDVCECGYFLISACMDGNAILRHGDTGDWVGTFAGHRGVVWSVALNKYAMLAASGSADFSAKIWDAVTGNVVQTLLHKGVVKSVAFDKASKLLVTAGHDQLLRIYDLECPELEPEYFEGHTRAIHRAIFCRDGRCVLSSSEDCTLRLWDRLSGIEVANLQLTHMANSLEVAKDDENLVTIAYDACVRFMNVQTMQMLKEYKMPSQISAASLHPAKKYFVCGGNDSKLYKYDYEQGDTLEEFKAHTGIVNTVKFSPDGEIFASGSQDGALRLWQTTVGKNYGLWRVVHTPEVSSIDAYVSSVQVQE